MKITTAKVKKELIKMGWEMPINDEYLTKVISDTLKVVNKILIEQKNIK